VAGLRTQNNERGDLLLAGTVAADERTGNAASDFIVPHFASGPGYTTEFVLMRTNAGSAAPVQVFNGAGQSLKP